MDATLIASTGKWKVPTTVLSFPCSCRADFVRWLQKTRGESTEEPPETSELKPPSELQCSLLQLLKARKVMGSAGEDAGYSNLLLHLLR